MLAIYLLILSQDLKQIVMIGLSGSDIEDRVCLVSTNPLSEQVLVTEGLPQIYKLSNSSA